MTKMISTTVLAQKYNMSSKEMFLLLLNYSYVEKKNDAWSLTDLGVEKGGRFQESKNTENILLGPKTSKST